MYKLVPVEPTDEMIESARALHEGAPILPISFYKAMIAAAPKVDQEPVEQPPLPWLTRLYNTAYCLGHGHTVEGYYSHVYPQDMDSYQEDMVLEWLEDNPLPAEKKPEHDVVVLVDALRNQLAEAQANDRTAMRYLTAVRTVVGGKDFPEMVRNVIALDKAATELAHYADAMDSIIRDLAGCPGKADALAGRVAAVGKRRAIETYIKNSVKGDKK